MAAHVREGKSFGSLGHCSSFWEDQALLGSEMSLQGPYAHEQACLVLPVFSCTDGKCPISHWECPGTSHWDIPACFLPGPSDLLGNGNPLPHGPCVTRPFCPVPGPPTVAAPPEYAGGAQQAHSQHLGARPRFLDSLGQGLPGKSKQGPSSQGREFRGRGEGHFR